MLAGTRPRPRHQQVPELRGLRRGLHRVATSRLVVSLEVTSWRALVLVLLVAALMGGLIIAAATDNTVPFAVIAVVDMVVILAFAWFGPDVW